MGALKTLVSALTSPHTVRAAAILALLASASLAGVAAYSVFTLPKVVGKAVTDRVDPAVKAIGERLDARDKQVGDVMNQVKQFLNDTYYDNYANVETTTVILRDVAEITNTIRNQTLPNVDALLTQVKSTMLGVQTDVHTLAQDVDVNLKSLKDVTDNAATLLDTANKQLAAFDVKGANESLEKVAKLLDDADKILADPNVQKTMAHVEGITDSTDKIFKQLSKKVGIMKLILNTAINILKVNLTAPRF